MPNTIDLARRTLVDLQSLATDKQYPKEVRRDAKARVKELTQSIISGHGLDTLVDHNQIWVWATTGIHREMVNGPEKGPTRHGSLTKSGSTTAQKGCGPTQVPQPGG